MVDALPSITKAAHADVILVAFASEREHRREIRRDETRDETNAYAVHASQRNFLRNRIHEKSVSSRTVSSLTVSDPYVRAS